MGENRKVSKGEVTYVYIVMADDCNEGDCQCTLESVDSVWFNKGAANTRAGQVYHGRVITEKVQR